MWQFSDGTIAYYANIAGIVYQPSCGSFTSAGYKDDRGRYVVGSVLCRGKSRAVALCETGQAKTAPTPTPTPTTSPGSDTNHTETGIRLGEPSPGHRSSRRRHSSLVVCPLGHLTHAFLACDEKTVCVQDGYVSGGASCSAAAAAAPPALKPLPPSFACDNGVQRVPYTLVCDHRPDCSDGSDESFCVFPPCDIDKPFHCGNRQVSRKFELLRPST